MQNWNVECVGQLYHYINGEDCLVLKNYFTEILRMKMKKDIQIACTIKNIFVGKSENLEEKKIVNKKEIPNKGIYINTLILDLLEVKRIIKLMSKSPSQMKRYGALVKLVPKQTSKINIRL